MGWKISYKKRDIFAGTVSNSVLGDDFGIPFGGIEGKTEDEAIAYAIDYIIEMLNCNGLFAKYDGQTLSTCDDEEEPPFEEYYDFKACKEYSLINAKGEEYKSFTPGKLGGHKKLKIYGRLDCPSAARYIAKGQYVKYRVFFPDEETAIAAGYRPCAKCMPEAYKKWKKMNDVGGD